MKTTERIEDITLLYEITKALKEQGEWRGEGAPPPSYQSGATSQ